MWDKLQTTEVALGHLTSLLALCVPPLRGHEVREGGRAKLELTAWSFIIPWVWVCHGTFVLAQVLARLC